LDGASYRYDGHGRRVLKSASSGAVVYHHDSSGWRRPREGAGPRRDVADAHAVYDHLYKKGDLIEAGCWAHARRYWFKALDTDPDRAKQVLAFIGGIFKLERAHGVRTLPGGRRGGDRGPPGRARGHLREGARAEPSGQVPGWSGALARPPEVPHRQGHHYSPGDCSAELRLLGLFAAPDGAV